MSDAYFDAFISYAHKDRPDWVHTLAESLHQRGFEIFLDAWEIGAGDVLIHKLDRGILESRHGVLVLTESYFERPMVRAEYAAILQRTIDGKQRVVPVLVDDVEVPPLLASRIWIDFRGADGPAYEAKREELVRALQGKKTKDRPARIGETSPPPGSRYRPEGALRRTLRLGRESVALLKEGEEEAAHTPPALDSQLEGKLYELGRVRKRGFAASGTVLRKGSAATEAAEASLHQASLAAGAELTRTFLDGAAGAALAEAVRLAASSGSSLELALEVADPDLRGLPWETLRLPAADNGGTSGEPLALHPRVQLYRAAPKDDPTPAHAIPGPLRILVAIGSPETGGGELLDYERELARVLDAVEPTRREGKPYVKILHRGTVEAIREALKAERFHVLHLSCHAGPGVLILENEEGDEDKVSAIRFWKEAVPENRGVPLLVLAGCSTALDVRRKKSDEDEDEGEEVLPGLATELLDHGVAAVLAMQASVSDPYATDLAGRLYRSLATHAEPDPLDALTEARRLAEIDRRKLDPDHPGYQLAEWATPALYLRGDPQILYDPTAPFEEIQEAPQARFAPGVVVRKVGEFVGRRREERLILKALRGGGRTGVLIRGIGGVGKSTLAAEVLTRRANDGVLVVSTYGETAPEGVLEEVGKAMLGAVQASGAAANHPLRETGVALRRADAEWSDRLELLQDHVLPQLPLVLFLDNFEDNLMEPEGAEAREVHNPALREFLTRWLARPGKSHILITCRYPFELPRKGHRYLEEHHLGPLSYAETRKLLWRLPALEALSPEDRLRAYRTLGGHPRTLEYLDALLRGGSSNFTDIEIRLEGALEQEGIENPGAWIRARVGKDLDKALAETVTLASADALLKDLLKLLDATSLARRLLLGASVYRRPVDQAALDWQISEEREPEPVPEGEAIVKRVHERAQGVREQGKEPTRENLGFTEAEWKSYDEALRRHLTPPLDIPEDRIEARDTLERLGLLSRFVVGEAVAFQVHRWTASALAEEAEPEILHDAHRRAARFWRWRVDKMPQSQRADIDQLLEARHHHHAAGDLEEAVRVTESICSQLDTWGDYSREEQLCREILEWVPERSDETASFLSQLGTIALKRGFLDDALRWYRDSLDIFQDLGNREGVAGIYHEFGIVAQHKGHYDHALRWYQKSLDISQELENRAYMARSYHQLGNVAQLMGRYDDALRWCRKSLDIKKGLVNRAGVASSYHQLANIAQHKGDYDDALRWSQKSLDVSQELGNRANMAQSYGQLGKVTQLKGDYDNALDWNRKALEMFEELGHRAGMATSISQIGVLLNETDRAAEAVSWNLRSLAIRLEMQVPEIRINLHWLNRQREILGSEPFEALVLGDPGTENAKTILEILDQFVATEKDMDVSEPES